MPCTAEQYAAANVFDPETNIRAGVRHLRSLHDRFAGQLSLALAAYNAGAGAVLRHNGIPPYPETRQYVNRVLRVYGRPDASPARAATRASTRKIRTEVVQAALSAPSVFRKVDANGVPLYTNVPPLVRSPRGRNR
jgi:hypothetical protein